MQQNSAVVRAENTGELGDNYLCSSVKLPSKHDHQIAFGRCNRLAQSSQFICVDAELLRGRSAVCNVAERPDNCILSSRPDMDELRGVLDQSDGRAVYDQQFCRAIADGLANLLAGERL